MRKRRGFGAIRRLPSGRWQASFVGPDLARHNASTTFDTKEDAEGWLYRQRSAVSDDDWAPPAPPRKRPTFGEYAETWLAMRDVRPRTRVLYDSLLRTHLDPAFGSVTLISITPMDVKRWYSDFDPHHPSARANA